MSSFSRYWWTLPGEARTFFALAALLVCGGAFVLGEGLYFRARATRVEGTVVGHGSRGRPVVAYRWGGQEYCHEESGPSERLDVGTTVGVYIAPEGPPTTRLDWAIGLLFLPGWFCLMPATFLALNGVVVAARGVRNPPI